MHIVYVLSQYPSLNETFIAREMAELVRLGHRLTLCVLRPRPQEGLPPGLSVPEATVLRAPGRSVLGAFLSRPASWPDLLPGLRVPGRLHQLAYLRGASSWFAARLRDEKVDHVRAHFLHSEAVSSMWLARSLGVPYSVTAHVTDVRHAWGMVRRAVAGAAFTAGITGEMCGRLRELGATEVHLVRTGVSLPSLGAAKPEPRERGLVLAVGSLIEPKGFPILVRACGVLKARGVAFHCRIVGEGEDRAALERLIAQLGLGGEVELAGALPFSQVLPHLSKASLVAMPCVPSRLGTDGLPTVLIEALALGTPVVSTRHAGIPDLVRDGETGLLCEPGDVNGLAAAIERLLADAALRERLAAAGQALVEAEFNTERSAGMLVELMSRRSRAARTAPQKVVG